MSICAAEGHVPAVTGERYGHCAKCHLDFFGLGAFDKHRRGPQSARYCVDPATDQEVTESGNARAVWWMDARGRWHEGDRSAWDGAEF